MGRRLPLLLATTILLTFLIAVLDATVISESLVDKTAAIATGAITVALSILSGGFLVLSSNSRTVRSGLASNPRGRKYVEELPGLILPAILCFSAAGMLIGCSRHELSTASHKHKLSPPQQHTLHPLRP